MKISKVVICVVFLIFVFQLTSYAKDNPLPKNAGTIQKYFRKCVTPQDAVGEGRVAAIVV